MTAHDLRRPLMRALRRLHASARAGAAAEPPDQAAQRLIWLHYRHLIATGQPTPTLGETGFRAYSQHDEDGLLLMIFAVIGTTSRNCVDLGFAWPDGANTTNLITNWGWAGLLVEARHRLARHARIFFGGHRDTRLWPPRVVEAWVTAENVNDILSDGGMTGDVDLLSIDLDGMDYWVWRSLEVSRPRVVLVETQLSWDAGSPVTVPYRPDFAIDDPGDCSYSGASLAAMVNLARSKGYHLIGTNAFGFNAFFLRNDLAHERLGEVTAEQCLQHPRALEAQRRRRAQRDPRPWVTV